MIPIGDDVRGGRFPLVTLLLLLLQAGWFATEWWWPDKLTKLCSVFELVPEKLGPLWDKEWEWFFGTPEGAFLFAIGVVPSLLSALFRHAGPVHLLVNLALLWTIGDDLEGRLGRLRYLVLLLGCCIAASAFTLWWEPTRTTAITDASGTLAGLLGAFLVMFPKARIKVLLPMMIGHIPILPIGLGWFALQWPPVRGILSLRPWPWFSWPALGVSLLAGILLVLVLRIGTRPQRAANPE